MHLFIAFHLFHHVPAYMTHSNFDAFRYCLCLQYFYCVFHFLCNIFCYWPALHAFYTALLHPLRVHFLLPTPGLCLPSFPLHAALFLSASSCHVSWTKLCSILWPRWVWSRQSLPLAHDYLHRRQRNCPSTSGDYPANGGTWSNLNSSFFCLLSFWLYVERSLVFVCCRMFHLWRKPAVWASAEKWLEGRHKMLE